MERTCNGNAKNVALAVPGGQVERAFVVLDTAPAGHTILLLDAAEAYHRGVTRTISDVPDAVRQLPPRLRAARAPSHGECKH